MEAATKEEIWRTALEQSALDLGCSPRDLEGPKSIVRSPFELGSRARRCYEPPIACLLVSYGASVAAMTVPECQEAVLEYVTRFEPAHCFETPAIHWLDGRLAPIGYRACLMAEFFLPDPSAVPRRDCGHETRVLGPSDFAGLYLPEWGNALCEKRRELDALGVGAYDEDGRLVGLAACSADCEEMWQIGVDVLPAFRRRGIAAALTSRLALEILERGKVPFYCCAWSNLASARNAIASGFVPAWAELDCRPADVVEALSRPQEQV